MIITCPECETKYRYDERRFDGSPVKKVKCTSCGSTFEAAHPDVEAPESKSPTDSGDADEPEQSTDMGPSWNPDLGDLAPQPPAPPEPEEEQAESEPDQERPIPPLPTDPRYSLAVIAGGQAGSVFQIHKPRIYLGRGSAMDIQLRDSEVSRRHAVLEIRDPEVTLTDLDATNGTWFDGAQIQMTKLGHQDEFTLGSTTLMLIVTPIRDAH